MDYMSWGEEYLEEAQVLKARAGCLRKQLKNAIPSKAKKLSERITLIYSMYLDCHETERLLQSSVKERGVRHEKETLIS